MQTSLRFGPEASAGDSFERPPDTRRLRRYGSPTEDFLRRLPLGLPQERKARSGGRAVLGFVTTQAERRSRTCPARPHLAGGKVSKCTRTIPDDLTLTDGSKCGSLSTGYRALRRGHAPVLGSISIAKRFARKHRKGTAVFCASFFTPPPVKATCESNSGVCPRLRPRAQGPPCCYNPVYRRTGQRGPVSHSRT